MDTTHLPPFPVLQAALRKTTEQLAVELHVPTARAPDWTAFEWRIARAAAAMQGISTLLANCLRWRGPDDWRDFLDQQAGQSVARERVISHLIARLDRALREAGLPAVALKGAALRELHFFYQPGERPMGDIDLLVAASDFSNVHAAMRRLDYVNAFNSRRHAVFEPRTKLPAEGFGEHASNALKIEVHSTISEALPWNPVDITALLRPAEPREGLNGYPTTAALLLHLLLHAAGNIRAHALRCIQLKDIALLAARMSTEDWRTFWGAGQGNSGLWWIYPPLALAERYFPQSVPSGVMASAALRCPRLLRSAAHRWQLTDVSWSNLRIHALPGLAWSRSPFESLRFAMSRAFPSRVAIDELAHGLRAQRSLEQVPWYALSHSRRVMRWLLGRPPRVQTMLSVRAALGIEGNYPCLHGRHAYENAKSTPT